MMLVRILNFYMFLLLGVTGLYIFDPLIRPYLIGAAALSMVLFFRTRSLGSSLLRSWDILLILFYVGLVVVTLFTPGANTTYLIVYALVFFLFYYSPALVWSKLRPHAILIDGFYASLCIMVLGLLQWSYQVSQGVEVLSLFRVKEIGALYGGGIYRNYGFSAEPGAYAFYLETVCFFLLLWSLQAKYFNPVVITVYGVVLLLSLVSTFSAGAFGSLGIALAITLVFGLRKARVGILLLSVTSIGFGVWALLNVSSFEPIYNKITLADSNSGTQRLLLWKIGLSEFSNNFLLGIGLGASEVIHGVSFLSYYITLLAEVGFLPFILLMIFMMFAITDSFRNKLIPVIYLWPFVAGIVHWSLISTFYYPYPFVLILLMRVAARNLEGTK